MCCVYDANERLRPHKDAAYALGSLAVHTRKDVTEVAVEALLQTMTTDSHGLALHQASSDALTQVR